MYKDLLEKASQSIETLNSLKNLACKIKYYELAAECRKLEKELFPETDEEVNAKKKAEELNLLFRMVDLNIENEVCYRIFSTLEIYRKKKGKFDLADAAKIQVKSKDLFKR